MTGGCTTAEMMRRARGGYRDRDHDQCRGPGNTNPKSDQLLCQKRHTFAIPCRRSPGSGPRPGYHYRGGQVHLSVSNQLSVTPIFHNVQLYLNFYKMPEHPRVPPPFSPDTSPDSHSPRHMFTEKGCRAAAGGGRRGPAEPLPRRPSARTPHFGGHYP